MSGEKSKKEILHEITEQELIDAGFCPECLDRRNKVSRLIKSGGCQACQECGFTPCE